MQEIFEIASRISTPLALAGFIAAAFFFIVRSIVAKNIFPTLTKQLSGDIIKLIIDRMFVLSLVAMVLGFAGFVVTHSAARTNEPTTTVDGKKSGNATTSGDNSPAVSGDGNSVTYGAVPDKKEKKDAKAKE
jgi:hypothetical protein